MINRYINKYNLWISAQELESILIDFCTKKKIFVTFLLVCGPHLVLYSTQPEKDEDFCVMQ